MVELVVKQGRAAQALNEERAVGTAHLIIRSGALGFERTAVVALDLRTLDAVAWAAGQQVSGWEAPPRTTCPTGRRMP